MAIKNTNTLLDTEADANVNTNQNATTIDSATVSPVVKPKQDYALLDDAGGTTETPTTTDTQDDSTTVVAPQNVAASILPEDWMTPQYEKDAKQMADLVLKQNLTEAEQAQLQSRQNIEKNANSANTDYTMLSYQQNQNIEKMGWSGGSYIDAKNQQEYLKASIQADLYGQLELQKYGYETELAKARAAYDVNQQQLALQYMETAYNRAFQMAQQTGIWIDPTVSDRLRQWDIANRTLEEQKENVDSDAYKQAKRVREEILASFGMSQDAPLSEAGVDVLRQLLEAQNLYNEDTYTAAQLANLKLETENAAALAEREITKQDEANYIYTFTFNGAETSVNLFSTLPEDKTKILALLEQRPDLFAKGMNTFSDKIMAEYTVWKAQPGNAEKNIGAFISTNPGVYAQQFELAKNWAKNLDKDSFVFYDKSGKRVNYSTDAEIPTNPEGPEVPTIPTIPTDIETDPENVMGMDFPFGETEPQYDDMIAAYNEFFKNGYGKEKSAGELAIDYANDIINWNKILAGTYQPSGQELTDLCLRFSKLSGSTPEATFGQLLGSKFGVSGSIFSFGSVEEPIEGKRVAITNLL